MDELDIPLPFEFLVEGTPVSLGGRTARWKLRVAGAAKLALPEDYWLAEGSIAVEIYHFPADEMVGDLDNIVKPILDALGSVVYIDDSQIDAIRVQRFPPGRAIPIRNPSDALVDAMASTKPVTYICVSRELDERQ